MGLGVTGVSELVLEVDDLEQAERFYAEILGLPVVERWEDRGAIWVMAGDRTRIGLWAPAGRARRRPGRPARALRDARRRPSATKPPSRALRERGADVEEHEFSAYEESRAAFVTDPFGHVVELWTWDVAGHLRMRVPVRLFAVLRERAGRAGSSSSCPRARAWPTRWPPSAPRGGLPLVMAVNREYAAADHPLARGRRARPDPAGERRGDRPRRTWRSATSRSRSTPSSRACVTRARAPSSSSRASPATSAARLRGVRRDGDRADDRDRRGAVERHGLCRAAAEHRVGRYRSASRP